MVQDGRFYEWSQTAEGDYRLRIWEEGGCIWDEIIPAEDFNS